MMSLHDIISNYAFNKMPNHGLLLLPLPTGAGKSYTVFKFIHDVLIEKQHNDKIIFVTSLKKNLQIDELKKHFSSEEEELFTNKVLFLKSNLDCVLENLKPLEENGNRIPLSIKDLKEYKNLWQAVDFCLKMESKPDWQIQDVVKAKKDEIQNTLERQFRQKIRNLLDADIKQKYGTKVGYKQKLSFLRTSKKWNWLLDLYPQILTKEKQVYLMSMDKFLLRNDPIIDKKYFIYKELAKNAIVFIDEFDATKDTILNRLLENAVKSQIDYVSAYKLIHDRLAQGDFPAEMTIASQKRLESEKRGYGKAELGAVIPNWIKRSNEIFDRFNMNYVFKNIDSESEDKAFLFQDVHSMTVSGKNENRRIVFKKSDDKKVNEISYTEKQAANKNQGYKNFKYMIKDVRGFLKFFCGGVQILAINLMQLRQEHGEEDFSFEESVSSILDNFFPSDTFSKIKQFFIDEILLYYSNKEENKKKEFDASFFENGFSYYAIEDDNQHALRSAIMMTSLESTPERILLELCKSARVFGISATANYDTVIGNYAIAHYLVPKLKNNFYELSSEEFEILENQFKDSISDYSKIKINVSAISSDENYNQDSWKRVFSDSENCGEIYTIINQKLSALSNKNNYLANRYLRISTVFKHFIETEDIKSFLCLLTKFPSTDAELSKDILEDIFNRISNNKLKFKDSVCILRSGNDYEHKKDEVLQKLSKGHKVLVISTYATIGAGQNLQYPIPQELKDSIVQINSWSKKSEKDFDALYLDRPTNLLTQLYESSEEKDFAKFISQIEYLKEVGELSLQNSRRIIKDAFIYRFYGGKQPQTNQNELDSFSNYATKVLVQAVGRICRTNMKNPSVYIFYDSSIANIINKAECDKNLLNPEFKALLEHIEHNSIIDNTEQKLAMIAIKKSDDALSRIIKYVSDGRNGWKEDAIAEWQSIRRFVLQHPTLSQEEYVNCEDLYQPFYMELPKPTNKYWFKREGDFNDISISFLQKDGYECVSSDSARLDNFLNIPQVKDLFEAEAFAKSFSENQYILCPPVFTNIYKGALGEYAGKRILESLGVKLEEITNPDFFELFDYKVAGKDVYVDFKHWNQYSAFLPRNGQKLQEHIFEKLKHCNGRTALIINIFAEETNLRKFLTTKEDDMRIIELAYLYDENSLTMNKEIFRILSEANR